MQITLAVFSRSHVDVSVEAFNWLNKKKDYIVVDIKYAVIQNNPSSLPYCGKMNNAADGDDEKTNDDGSNSDVEGVPAQSSWAIIVTLIITASGLEQRKPSKT